MIKIVADDNIPYLKGVLEPYAEMVYLPGQKITRSDILNAECLITRTRTICDERLLHGTKVRLIASATSGFEHIDATYSAMHNISWYNAAGCNSTSVVQYIASALATLSMQDGYELKGKTLGIIGVGYVGSKVAALAQILEMNVLLNDPPRARMEGEKFFIPVEKLIADSDIVTLHVPLYLTGSDKTYHLANEAFFSGIRKRIYFINTSRGEVVDGLALKKAVKLGKIKACVLDVWENEPDIDTGILRIARLATPHIAGYSVDGKVNGTKMCVDTINRFFNFGMDDQRHIVVPQPKQPLITINCSGKSPEKVLLEAILGTYSIEEDDHRLRSSPRTFELQRNDYPIRREFPAYSLQLINPVQNIGELLENLGFKVMQ